MRNLLQDLRNRVVSTAEFRKQLDAIVKDPEALAALTADIDKLVPPDASDTPPAA
jgi:predicted component of type VI protein secretion system